MTNKRFIQLKKRYIKEGYKLAKKKLLKENYQNHLDRTIDKMLHDTGFLEELHTIIDEAISIPHERFEDDYDTMDSFYEIKDKFVADVIEQSKTAINKIVNNTYQYYVEDANDLLSYYE